MVSNFGETGEPGMIFLIYGYSPTKHTREAMEMFRHEMLQKRLVMIKNMELLLLKEVMTERQVENVIGMKDRI